MKYIVKTFKISIALLIITMPYIFPICNFYSQSVVTRRVLGKQAVTQVGFVGLGAMGMGMAEVISKNGITIFGTDINSETRDRFDETGVGTSAVDLEAMVKQMGEGRKVIWLMVPHGTPVNENIDKIIELKRQGLLNEGDIVVDGGNSNHILHRSRAERLLEEGIILLGAGTSGGTAAAGNMSIMVGGNQEAYQQCQPVLEALGMEGGYNWFGEAGAGHFVKSVHNGIEYSFFQVLAEGIEVLANYFGWNQEKLAEVIGNLQDSNISSWTMELALEVAGDGVFSEVGPHILGGSTGTWTQEDAERLGIATPALDATLQARIDSIETDLENYQIAPGDFAASFIALIRNKMGSHEYDELSEEITPEMRCDVLGIGSERINVEEQVFIENVLSAITYGWLMVLKEGYEVIAASEYTIDTQGLANLSTVWQNGSVIRSHLIGLAEAHFQVGEDVQTTFNNIAQDLGLEVSSIKWLNEIANSLNTPTPAFDAILESIE
ncbi:MAG: NAD(P)-binding domain-containing protein [Candidatus Saelkia tenebricola]|nr:NAD(P)-binding domain-containing protein [Candidatus Saelkia tenebricola]